MHTKEPWKVRYDEDNPLGIRWGIVDAERDITIADCLDNAGNNSGSIAGPVNARRIVACVNAFVGWETKTIERFCTDGAPGRPNIGQAFAEATQHRNLLLSALQKAVLVSESLAKDHEYCNEWQDAMLVMRAAIAKVKE